jgi:transketolase C-terminal domain/subunit
VEDHTIVGGLGSAVAEYMSAHPCQASLLRLGLPDIFAQSGECEELLDYYGLSPAAIYGKAIEAMTATATRKSQWQI